MKNLVIASKFLIAVLISNIAFSQNKNLTSIFSRISENDQLNGNVFISQDKETLYQSSVGYADFSRKEKVTQDNTFPIASISKLFTSIAVMQLKEKGKLSLDDKVKTILPEFIYDNITIRQLLSHTSGLKDYEIFFKSIGKQNGKPFTNQDVLTVLKENNPSLNFEPGQKYKYSNIGYNVLALIVEKKSGLSFNEYIKQNIFKSAKLKCTYLPVFDKPNNKQVTLYRFKSSYTSEVISVDSLKDKNIKIFQTFFNSFYGSDGICSNTEDLKKLSLALQHNLLIKEATFQEMITPTLLNDGNKATQIKKSFEGNIYIGLGLFILKDESIGKVIFHDGSNPGLEACFVINTSKKQTAIVLSNRQDEAVNQMAYQSIKALNKVQYFIPKRSLGVLCARMMKNDGIDKALLYFNQLKSDTANYYFNEALINDIGYEFLNDSYMNEALAFFKLNTELYPTSANCFDSYGEALAIVGKKEEAIKFYKKALELEPNKKTSIEALTKLEK
jgi:CubicO group peptidase (beta-lactamase class C family)